jgi:hypothetical protein
LTESRAAPPVDGEPLRHGGQALRAGAGACPASGHHPGTHRTRSIRRFGDPLQLLEKPKPLLGLRGAGRCARSVP